jgi:hypothetical protein
MYRNCCCASYMNRINSYTWLYASKYNRLNALSIAFWLLSLVFSGNHSNNLMTSIAHWIFRYLYCCNSVLRSLCLSPFLYFSAETSPLSIAHRFSRSISSLVFCSSFSPLLSEGRERAHNKGNSGTRGQQRKIHEP